MSSPLTKLRPPSKVTPSPRRTRTKATKKSEGLQQMLLDFGQKGLGPRQCGTCGIVYTPKNPADKLVHDRFCQQTQKVLLIRERKLDNVKREYDNGDKVVSVSNKSTKKMVERVTSVLAIVDKELGFVTPLVSLRDSQAIFLYIREKMIIGLVVMEHITEGYRVVSSPLKSIGNQTGNSQAERAWYSSSEPERAMVGVSRIWVLSKHRRQGIASELLDCALYSMSLTIGRPLSRGSDLAFSDPTPNGRQFASKFCGTENFLVYKCKSFDDDDQPSCA